MKTVKWGALALFLFISVSVCAQTWKGKIIYGFAGGEIKQFDLATKSDKVLLKEAKEPFLAPSGDIYFKNDNFRKRNLLLRKSNSTLTQFRDVLDMTIDNPEYKSRLENYSFIQKTGNDAVLSNMYNPKISPNGKYLSVTILGYGENVFNKNCVGIFDLASGKLVAKFEEKYHGSWMPDNRIVVAGAEKTVSSDGSMYKAKTPGLFVSDAGFTSLTRIDKDLDDPSPYHPAVSPDGKQVAFVMNDHVWVMGINGTNLRQLTAVDNDNIETFPAWSPDGKYVACWVYKTFERSYYTALAIVPATAAKPVALSNAAPVWPKDLKGYRLSGGSMQFSWKYDGFVAPVVNTQAQPGPGKAPAPNKAPAPPRQPAVGSKVKIEAEDGKRYTGTILQVQNGKYNVRYDGVNFTAWLTRDQFEME